MRIAVFGTGGVGGYFGGRLAQAGEEVIFIARGAHLLALQQSGLRVESIKGDFSLPSVQASDDPASAGMVDAVLVCVKSWMVPEAGRAMRPMVGPQTIIVPLENGVEAPGQLSTALDSGHVLGGLCHISAMLASPGHIRHPGIEPHIAFGELDGSRNEKADQLQAAFQRAGVWAEVPEDITAAMWEKFLFIASFSGVGAVARATAGVIRTVPETRRLIENALEEIHALARARQVLLPADIVARTLAFIDNIAPGVSSSMQRDIIAGRPSELEAQNGAVVRMGIAAGVPTPTHAFLYAALLPQELQARSQ